jgi:hypothetical protein
LRDLTLVSGADEVDVLAAVQLHHQDQVRVLTARDDVRRDLTGRPVEPSKGMSFDAQPTSVELARTGTLERRVP